MNAPHRSVVVFLLTALAGSAAALVGLEERADACEPPMHRLTTVAPSGGESIPASTPGILVSGEDGVGLQVFDGKNSAVAGTIKTDGGRKYFAPSAPLSVGKYSLLYDEYAPGTGAAPGTYEKNFEVTAAVPLPGQTGALGVAMTDRATRPVSTSSGSCTEDADVAMVRLALSMDSSLAPYGAVVAWEAKVDGQTWATAQGTLPVTDGVRTVLNLYTACDGGSKYRDNGVSPGIHNVTLQPILVGAGTQIAPAQISVTVSCGSDNGTVQPSSIGEQEDPNGNGGHWGEQGEGDDGSYEPSDSYPPGYDQSPTYAATTADTGCSTAPARHGSFGFASVVGLVALAAARLRRRVRR